MQKYTKLLSVALITLALTIAYSVLPTKVLAEVFDLSVSPPIFQIELTPPANADVKQQITLQNSGDEPLDLDIVFKHFIPNKENGDITYLDTDETPGNDPLIFQRVSIQENGERIDSVTIPPKTTKKYDLRVSVPKDEPASDYYFSILFVKTTEPNKTNEAGQTADTTEQPTSSSAIGGVAINVLLSIGPKGQTTGSIEEFSTPFFQGSGPVPFMVRVKNSSDHFIYPKGVIEIKNMFGQRIGQIDLLPLNILSGMTRSLPSKEQFIFELQKQKGEVDEKTLKKLEEFDAKFNKDGALSAIWPEKFLLGPYTATLTIGMADEGPIYKRSIVFIGFPLMLFIGFIIAIAIILLIRSRLMHREKLIRK